MAKTRAIYADSSLQAVEMAKKIARKESLPETFEVQEKNDASGGTYYLIIWRT